MPLFDYYCKSCGFEEDDVLVKNADDIVICKICENELEKRPPNFSFRMTPGAISKWKKKYGNTLPQEYKTSGGCNIYSRPRKRKGK